jgi:hypothetical protein
MCTLYYWEVSFPKKQTTSIFYYFYLLLLLSLCNYSNLVRLRPEGLVKNSFPMDKQKQKKTTFHTASSKPSRSVIQDWIFINCNSITYNSMSGHSEEFQKLKFQQQSGVKSDFQPSQSRLTLQHISSTTIMYSLNSCSPVFQIYQPTLIVVAISILLLFLVSF